MSTSEKQISPMDKVRLRLKAVPQQDDAPAAPAESEATFIYGIGSAGVPAFEKMLFAKAAGDQITLSVDSSEDCALFGHLNHTVLQAVGMKPPYMLHVTVVSVAAASDQEVVKAMARSTACGGGCDCGCGH
jgi:hypothetical protein